jgi:hypothetical protein
MNLDEMIKYDLVWYRRLWRWLFPPKKLAIKELGDISHKLTKDAIPGDKVIMTTMGNFKIRKNGRVILAVDKGKKREHIRCTPINKTIYP